MDLGWGQLKVRSRCRPRSLDVFTNRVEGIFFIGDRDTIESLKLYIGRFIGDTKRVKDLA